MKTIKRVRLVIFRDSELLLLKKPSKRNFTLPGGIVKKKETLKEALIREVEEEIGANIKKSDLKHLADVSISKKGVRYSNYYFLLIGPERFDFKLLETEKFEELKWVNAINALKNLKVSEKFLVEEVILKKGSGKLLGVA